ncbi:MAG TPA: hypothetical protein ENI15_13745 [Spirochaetes bacterium]|nr:hypothetical protein [Spirochaetota bacterium]
MQISLFSGKRAMFISIIVILFLITPAISLLAQDNYIPKDPVFARRIALLTGIGAPTIFGLAGLIFNISVPENMTMSQGILLSNMITTMGILAPPLGNLYAGEFNKIITITYGASNIFWLTGTILYYRKGLTDSAPGPFPIIFWGLGFLGRYGAGVWDWITAAETVVQKNSTRGAKTKRAFSSYYIDPAGSKIGVKFSFEI